jgi:hypothetical protein
MLSAMTFFIDQDSVKVSTNLMCLLVVTLAFAFWVGMYCIYRGCPPCNWIKMQKLDFVPDREGAKCEQDIPEAFLELWWS